MKPLEFGDMVFYAAMGLILILLLWLRFLEASAGLWGAWIAWAAWVAFLVSRYRRGRRINKSQNARSDKGAIRRQSTETGGKP